MSASVFACASICLRERMHACLCVCVYVVVLRGRGSWGGMQALRACVCVPSPLPGAMPVHAHVHMLRNASQAVWHACLWDHITHACSCFPLMDLDLDLKP